MLLYAYIYVGSSGFAASVLAKQSGKESRYLPKYIADISPKIKIMKTRPLHLKVSDTAKDFDETHSK